MEHKSISLEFKDLSKEKRTAIIAHAVYGVIDRVGDISTKGMFSSSWARKEPIDFLFNHADEDIVGNVLGTYEDEEKAYTKVSFGKWKLGDDVIEMAEAGVLRGASFGYDTEKKEDVLVKSRKIRKLTQVKHLETSLLTRIPANPLAGIVQLNKALNGKEGKEMFAHVERMEKFCRNSTASDETIKLLLSEIDEIKSIFSKYDTASTPLITDGDASANREFADSLYLLTLKHF